MRNKYNLRKNFKGEYWNNNQIIKGKIAFKTQETNWLGTTLPVVILVSIHSSFHEKINGHLKMNALVSTIKNSINGKISILFADVAHLHTLSLSVSGASYDDCLKAAQELAQGYQPYFTDCELQYWHFAIWKDKNYVYQREQIWSLYQTDPFFRSCLYKDAEMAYTAKRRQEFPDKTLFIEKTIADIMELCVCILVLTHQGYRYLFYPGLPCSATEYMNRLLVPPENQLHWINVFLTIEKKTEVFYAI